MPPPRSCPWNSERCLTLAVNSKSLGPECSSAWPPWTPRDRVGHSTQPGPGLSTVTQAPEWTPPGASQGLMSCTRNLYPHSLAAQTLPSNQGGVPTCPSCVHSTRDASVRNTGGPEPRHGLQGQGDRDRALCVALDEWPHLSQPALPIPSWGELPLPTLHELQPVCSARLPQPPARSSPERGHRGQPASRPESGQLQGRSPAPPECPAP